MKSMQRIWITVISEQYCEYQMPVHRPAVGVNFFYVKLWECNLYTTKLVIFLCSVISQGKVVALDR